MTRPHLPVATSLILTTGVVATFVPSAAQAQPAAPVPHTKVTITARSDLYRSVGARIRVGLNGRTAGTIQTGASWRTTTVSLPRPVKPGDEVQLFFDNDMHGPVNGKRQDRNLHLKDVTIGKSRVAVTAMRYDLGGTWAAATDGRNIAAGQPLLRSAGALRHVVPVPTAAKKKKAKVFAHYMPLFSRSIDDVEPTRDYYSTQWLVAAGEAGKHRASGGFLRDRPLPRASLGKGYRIADAKAEIAAAKAAGVDGFMVDVLTTSGHQWDQLQALVRAADAVGNFSIIPTIDMYGELSSWHPERVARVIGPLYTRPSVRRESIISSFAAEVKPNSWWTQVMVGIKGRAGVRPTLHAVLLDASPSNTKRLSAIATALGSWGGRTPTAAAAEAKHGRSVHALKRQWISPVALQDARPSSGLYAEARNTETFRKAWEVALRGQAEFVHLVTWNDYSESSSLAPSVDHGHAFVKLNKYYADRLHGRSTSRRKEITITYRVHPARATARSAIRRMSPTLAGSTEPPRDGVEVLTVLDRAAQVTVRVGRARAVTYRAPAGLSTKVLPLSVGRIQATVAGGAKCSLASSQPVVARPQVTDLGYHADWTACG